MMSLLVGWGLFRVATGDLGQLPMNHPALDHFTGGQAVLTGASSFLLLRAFSSGAVALSGVEAISNGIQAFRKPESRNAAITLDLGRDDPRHAVPRHRRARRSPASDAEPRPDDPVDHGSRRLRHRTAVLAAAGVDRHDPHAVGEHGVRRLPAPVGHRRERRLPAAPAREPRRPPGALERHSRARVRGRLVARRVRRRRERTDSAVRGRTVHVVHALADRHGRAPLAPAAARAGDADSPSTAWARWRRPSSPSSSSSRSSPKGPGSRRW